MSNKIQVDADGLNVETITSITIDEYLEVLAKEKIWNAGQISNLAKTYMSKLKRLELDDLELNKKLLSIIKNRKTILKARLKEENISLNNLLAEAFPDSFSPLEEAPPETIITVDNPLQCMRLIARYNEATDSFDKINCLEILKTVDEKNIHIQNHQMQGELI